MDWFPQFVTDHLTFKGKCYRHCEKPTSMRIISQGPSRVVGAYVCPDSFVSQVVYFTTKPDVNWFEDMISGQVGKENFAHRDIRVASRHGWELGKNSLETLEAKLGPNPSVTEVYWTRYPRTEDQKQVAISLCTGNGSADGCLRLFAHNRNRIEKLCPSCRSKLGR